MCRYVQRIRVSAGATRAENGRLIRPLTETGSDWVRLTRGRANRVVARASNPILFNEIRGIRPSESRHIGCSVAGESLGGERGRSRRRDSLKRRRPFVGVEPAETTLMLGDAGTEGLRTALGRGGAG